MPVLPPSIKTPHKHAFIEIFLLTEGVMVHDVDYEIYSVTPGSVFFIAKGRDHRWFRDAAEKRKGYRLMLDENFLKPLFTGGDVLLQLLYLYSPQMNPIFCLTPAQLQRLEGQFSALYHEYRRTDANEAALRSHLFLLLLEISRIAGIAESPSEGGGEKQMLSTFFQTLETSFAQHPEVEYYAQQLRVSSERLNRVLKKFTGKTISQMIGERIVLEAKRLLTGSELTVNEIAYTLGMNDPSYFVRFFRKTVGTTPTSFRKS